VNPARNWMLALLLAAVVLSAIAVVYSKYLSRTHFVVLQELQAEREQLGIEWGRLQIEHSTLASPGRIEQMAADKLNMKIPEPAAVVVIGP
jgi:cell division protein FtsL